MDLHHVATRTVPNPAERGHPLLDAAAERELARDVEAGLVAVHLLSGELSLGCSVSADELRALQERGERAWARLWEANLRLVWHLAWRASRRTGLGVEELGSEGQLALAEALMRWDHRRGVRVSTLAWKWISHAMTAQVDRRLRHGRELCTDGVDLDRALPSTAGPEERLEALLDLSWLAGLGAPERALVRELRREPAPTPQELCDRLGLSRSGLSRLRRRLREQVGLALAG